MDFEPFRLQFAEARTSCAVFSSPHSGSNYPDDFMARVALDPHEIRSSEDAFVDELFASSTRFGAPLLSANYPRAYVDLNRSRDEIDPAVVHGTMKRGMNPRIAAGLGVIPRVVSDGRPIMRGKISLADAERRLIVAYEPYHSALAQLINGQLNTFGAAILFDCHSMPHRALISAPSVRNRRPDVILGDRFGASCDYMIAEETSAAFTDQGFVVARNAPFAGGYITQFYGRPSRNVHALQIEIDRAIYMDEKSLGRSASFNQVSERLSRVIRTLCDLGQYRLSLAAE